MRTTPPALLLSRADVMSVLNLDDCIMAVEAAFRAHANGESLRPGLLHGDGVGGEFHLKAGGLRQPRAYYACKINGSFFENRIRHDLPNIQGLIVLYDATNGVPLAVMESATVTILRTGAATAVAAKYLSRRDAAVATVCGAGLQGAVQMRALSRVLSLRQINIWSRDMKRASTLAEQLTGELGISVRAVPDFATATRCSDVIVTCTPAKKWFLGRGHVQAGAFIAAVGADGPEKQEIEPELVATSAVVCDLLEQCLHVGDLHHAIAAGLMRPEQVRAELGAIITGRASGRAHDDEIVLFDSTGTALQDVAAAALVYERAIAAGRGTRFGFWS